MSWHTRVLRQRQIAARVFAPGVAVMHYCCNAAVIVISMLGPHCYSAMQAYYPSRLMSTGYNMMYMVLISALFRWGAGVWPSKHSRMLTGYLLYVAALATPPAVSGVAGYTVLSPAVHTKPETAGHIYAHCCRCRRCSGCCLGADCNCSTQITMHDTVPASVC